MDFSKELLLIDKPAGITSFDVIRRLRRAYGAAHNGQKAPKMGHAGTLDPAATGLMLIGVGLGTKKLKTYLKLDKEYVAEVLLGMQTDSGDLDGRVLVEQSVAALTDAFVREVVESLIGELTLPVSAYSAIKVAGVPMYKRARQAAKKGEVIEAVPLRTMVVKEVEYLGTQRIEDRVIVTVRFVVGSGTYIRSLGEEIGRRLSLPATLQSLRRTQIGEWRVDDAESLAPQT